MSEPRKVQNLKNVNFVPINDAATAYRAVPNGETTKVRRNRTEQETLAQIARIGRLYKNSGRLTQASRIFGRTINAMTANNRWGKL